MDGDTTNYKQLLREDFLAPIHDECESWIVLQFSSSDEVAMKPLIQSHQCCWKFSFWLQHKDRPERLSCDLHLPCYEHHLRKKASSGADRRQNTKSVADKNVSFHCIPKTASHLVFPLTVALRGILDETGRAQLSDELCSIILCVDLVHRTSGVPLAGGVCTIMHNLGASEHVRGLYRASEGLHCQVDRDKKAIDSWKHLHSSPSSRSSAKVPPDDNSASSSFQPAQEETIRLRDKFASPAVINAGSNRSYDSGKKRCNTAALDDLFELPGGSFETRSSSCFVALRSREYLEEFLLASQAQLPITFSVFRTSQAWLLPECKSDAFELFMPYFPVDRYSFYRSVSMGDSDSPLGHVTGAGRHDTKAFAFAEGATAGAVSSMHDEFMYSTYLRERLHCRRTGRTNSPSTSSARRIQTGAPHTTASVFAHITGTGKLLDSKHRPAHAGVTSASYLTVLDFQMSEDVASIYANDTIIVSAFSTDPDPSHIAPGQGRQPTDEPTGPLEKELRRHHSDYLGFGALDRKDSSSTLSSYVPLENINTTVKPTEFIAALQDDEYYASRGYDQDTGPFGGKLDMNRTMHTPAGSLPYQDEPSRKAEKRSAHDGCSGKESSYLGHIVKGVGEWSVRSEVHRHVSPSSPSSSSSSALPKTPLALHEIEMQVYAMTVDYPPHHFTATQFISQSKPQAGEEKAAQVGHERTDPHTRVTPKLSQKMICTGCIRAGNLRRVSNDDPSTSEEHGSGQHRAANIASNILQSGIYEVDLSVAVPYKDVDCNLSTRVHTPDGHPKYRIKPIVVGKAIVKLESFAGPPTNTAVLDEQHNKLLRGSKKYSAWYKKLLESASGNVYINANTHLNYMHLYRHYLETINNIDANDGRKQVREIVHHLSLPELLSALRSNAEYVFEFKETIAINQPYRSSAALEMIAYSNKCIEKAQTFTHMLLEQLCQRQQMSCDVHTYAMVLRGCEDRNLGAFLWEYFQHWLTGEGANAILEGAKKPLRQPISMPSMHDLLKSLLSTLGGLDTAAYSLKLLASLLCPQSLYALSGVQYLTVDRADTDTSSPIKSRIWPLPSAYLMDGIELQEGMSHDIRVLRATIDIDNEAAGGSGAGAEVALSAMSEELLLSLLQYATKHMTEIARFEEDGNINDVCSGTPNLGREHRVRLRSMYDDVFEMDSAVSRQSRQPNPRGSERPSASANGDKDSHYVDSRSGAMNDLRCRTGLQRLHLLNAMLSSLAQTTSTLLDSTLLCVRMGIPPSSSSSSSSRDVIDNRTTSAFNDFINSVCSCVRDCSVDVLAYYYNAYTDALPPNEDAILLLCRPVMLLASLVNRWYINNPGILGLNPYDCEIDAYGYESATSELLSRSVVTLASTVKELLAKIPMDIYSSRINVRSSSAASSDELFVLYKKRSEGDIRVIQKLKDAMESMIACVFSAGATPLAHFSDRTAAASASNHGDSDMNGGHQTSTLAPETMPRRRRKNGHVSGYEAEAAKSSAQLTEGSDLASSADSRARGQALLKASYLLHGDSVIDFLGSKSHYLLALDASVSCLADLQCALIMLMPTRQCGGGLRTVAHCSETPPQEAIGGSYIPTKVPTSSGSRVLTPHANTNDVVCFTVGRIWETIFNSITCGCERSADTRERVFKAVATSHTDSARWFVRLLEMCVRMISRKWKHARLTMAGDLEVLLYSMDGNGKLFKNIARVLCDMATSSLHFSPTAIQGYARTLDSRAAPSPSGKTAAQDSDDLMGESATEVISQWLGARATLFCTVRDILLGIFAPQSASLHVPDSSDGVAMTSKYLATLSDLVELYVDLSAMDFDLRPDITHMCRDFALVDKRSKASASHMQNNICDDGAKICSIEDVIESSIDLALAIPVSPEGVLTPHELAAVSSLAVGGRHDCVDATADADPTEGYRRLIIASLISQIDAFAKTCMQNAGGSGYLGYKPANAQFKYDHVEEIFIQKIDSLLLGSFIYATDRSSAQSANELRMPSNRNHLFALFPMLEQLLTAAAEENAGAIGRLSNALPAYRDPKVCAKVVSYVLSELRSQLGTSTAASSSAGTSHTASRGKRPQSTQQSVIHSLYFHIRRKVEALQSYVLTSMHRIWDMRSSIYAVTVTESALRYMGPRAQIVVDHVTRQSGSGPGQERLHPEESFIISFLLGDHPDFRGGSTGVGIGIVPLPVELRKVDAAVTRTSRRRFIAGMKAASLNSLLVTMILQVVRDMARLQGNGAEHDEQKGVLDTTICLLKRFKDIEKITRELEKTLQFKRDLHNMVELRLLGTAYSVEMLKSMDRFNDNRGAQGGAEGSDKMSITDLCRVEARRLLLDKLAGVECDPIRRLGHGVLSVHAYVQFLLHRLLQQVLTSAHPAHLVNTPHDTPASLPLQLPKSSRRHAAAALAVAHQASPSSHSIACSDGHVMELLTGTDFLHMAEVEHALAITAVKQLKNTGEWSYALYILESLQAKAESDKTKQVEIGKRASNRANEVSLLSDSLHASYAEESFTRPLPIFYAVCFSSMPDYRAFRAFTATTSQDSAADMSVIPEDEEEEGDDEDVDETDIDVDLFAYIGRAQVDDGGDVAANDSRLWLLLRADPTSFDSGADLYLSLSDAEEAVGEAEGGAGARSQEDRVPLPLPPSSYHALEQQLGKAFPEYRIVPPSTLAPALSQAKKLTFAPKTLQVFEAFPKEAFELQAAIVSDLERFSDSQVPRKAQPGAQKERPAGEQSRMCSQLSDVIMKNAKPFAVPTFAQSGGAFSGSDEVKACANSEEDPEMLPRDLFDMVSNSTNFIIFGESDKAAPVSTVTTMTLSLLSENARKGLAENDEGMLLQASQWLSPIVLCRPLSCAEKNTTHVAIRLLSYRIVAVTRLAAALLRCDNATPTERIAQARMGRREMLSRPDALLVASLTALANIAVLPASTALSFSQLDTLIAGEEERRDMLWQRTRKQAKRDLIKMAGGRTPVSHGPGTPGLDSDFHLDMLKREHDHSEEATEIRQLKSLRQLMRLLMEDLLSISRRAILRHIDYKREGLALNKLERHSSSSILMGRTSSTSPLFKAVLHKQKSNRNVPTSAETSEEELMWLQLLLWAEAHYTANDSISE